MKKILLGLIILMICLLSAKSLKENHDLYNLEFDLKDNQIYLTWNIVNEEASYLLTIYEDDIQVYSQWVVGNNFVIKDDFSGDHIEFKVAASGREYSKSVNYIKFKPVLYNPYGTIEPSEISFSWSSDKNIKFYNIEISSLTRKYEKIYKTREDFLILPNILPGEYKWRVIPYTDIKTKGIASDWAYFNMSPYPLDESNIIGIEKNIKTSYLSTPLTYPESAIMDDDGSVFISDTHSNVIRKCSDNISEIVVGNLIAGKNDSEDPSGFMLNQPGGIIFDSDGNLIFSDMGNGRLCKYDIKKNNIEVLWNHGEWVKNVYLESDSSLTILTASGKIINNKHGALFNKYRFKYPSSMIREGNKAMVLDSIKNELVLFKEDTFVDKISLNNHSSALFIHKGDIYLGEHTTIYKLGWDFSKEVFSDGYANVSNISLGKNDELLVTDSDAGNVYTLNLLTKKKNILVGAKKFFGAVVEIEKYGEHLYLLDNQASIVWKYNPNTGLTERFIGNGKSEIATLGANRLETGLFYPTGLTSDVNGNFYIAEQHHILKINSKGVVEIFAGRLNRDEYGYKDGESQEALFQSIRGITFDDRTKSLYIADTYNNRIRKVQNGIVSTVAGNGATGEPKFGEKATNTYLSRPHDVIIKNDEIIISDSWNNIVSKVDKYGILHPLVGKVKYTGYQGNGSYFGENINSLNSLLNTPLNLFYDGEVLYVIDSFNNRVRVIENGKIRTIIGNDFKGYDSENASILNMPTAIYVDDNYIYLADSGNYLVRKYSKNKYSNDN